jgi:hypothetical protein
LCVCDVLAADTGGGVLSAAELSDGADGDAAVGGGAGTEGSANLLFSSLALADGLKTNAPFAGAAGVLAATGFDASGLKELPANVKEAGGAGGATDAFFGASSAFDGLTSVVDGAAGGGVLCLMSAAVWLGALPKAKPAKGAGAGLAAGGAAAADVSATPLPKLPLEGVAACCGAPKAKPANGFGTLVAGAGIAEGAAPKLNGVLLLLLLAGAALAGAAVAAPAITLAVSPFCCLRAPSSFVRSSLYLSEILASAGVRSANGSASSRRWRGAMTERLRPRRDV